jgi:hypothetical protein
MFFDVVEISDDEEIHHEVGGTEVIETVSTSLPTEKYSLTLVSEKVG